MDLRRCLRRQAVPCLQARLQKAARSRHREAESAHQWDASVAVLWAWLRADGPDLGVRFRVLPGVAMAGRLDDVVEVLQSGVAMEVLQSGVAAGRQRGVAAEVLQDDAAVGRQDDVADLELGDSRLRPRPPPRPRHPRCSLW